MAKRGQGEGTISKREDGTWWARITIGKDENGKQKRKAFYGKTRKEVQEKLAAAVNDVNKNTYIEPSSMTIACWMDIWLSEYKKIQLKPRTYMKYRFEYNRYIVPALGRLPIKDLRADMVQKFINEMASKVSASTVIATYSILRASLRQACLNDMLAKNPADGAKLPIRESRAVHVLTPEEQERFIKTANDEYLGDIFIIELATGLRIGEALALTWDDVDFEEEVLNVNKTQGPVILYDEQGNAHREIVTGTPKTKSSNRTIPLLPEVVGVLKHLQADHFSPNNNKVFCNLKGKPVDQSYVVTKLHRICDKAGIGRVNFHSLRHTFATRCLESGIELKVVQELLGHASIRMTADLYTHVLPDKKKESIMKLQNTIKI